MFGLEMDQVAKIKVIGVGGGGNNFDLIFKYMRKNKTGVVLRNSADKFPDNVALTIKAIYVAPCEEGVKAAYIYLPALNVDPNVSISTESDTTIDYKGDLAVDMCADNKDLYVIYFPDEDEDE